MTTEIEKTFFDTFGIEQKEHKECQCDYLNCPNPDIEECEECYYYKTYKFDYPQITDRIYLMLLATLTCISNIEFPFADIQKLKEDILKEVIKHQYGFDNHQVRTLFEEG